jgi:hypothetical protein
VQKFSGIAPVTERRGKKKWVHFRWACSKFLRQSFHEWAGHSIAQSVWARAYYQQYFLVYVNPRDLLRFLLAWKRQNARVKDYAPSRATTFPLGAVARHRLVQIVRSRSNSKTASLHPERKPTCAVHAP